MNTTMNTKYFLFQLSNEWESFVGVVEMTPEYRKTLLERMDLAKTLPHLAWLQYFDLVEVYENSDEIEAWISENADLESFERDGKVFTDKEPDCLTDKEPDCAGWASARVDVSYVQVDDSCCFWEVRLKHADYSMETPPIYRNDLSEEGGPARKSA